MTLIRSDFASLDVSVIQVFPWSASRSGFDLAEIGGAIPGGAAPAIPTDLYSEFMTAVFPEPTRGGQHRSRAPVVAP